MLIKVGQKFETWMRKVLPDPLVIAIILTLIVGLLAVIFTPTTPIQVVENWSKGFWELIAFTMQVAFGLIAGAVLAKSPIVNRGMVKLCSLPKKNSTLIENPLDLTPDAMLQRGQPFQNFFKSVPLVNAHHKPVTWNINRLEELPFLLHCVEFNAIFVVEAVVVVLVAHQVFGKNPVLVFFLWRKDVLFLFIRSGIAGRKTGALQTVCNQLLDFFNTAMLLNETGQVLRLLERTELQPGFSFINGASMLKQVQAKLIVDRLCFLGWQKSTFSKEIADSRMFLAHISPPHITAPAHARCHRPGAEQGTL